MEEHIAQSLQSSPPVVPQPVRNVVPEEHISPALRHVQMRSPTLRDFLAVIFRHRLLLVSSFLAILLTVIAATLMLPKQYEAHMKILVKGERADPLVTPASNSQSWPTREVTQEDLNSEVELLRSRDLLEKVVVTCGLHTLPGSSLLDRWLNETRSNGKEASGQDLRIPRAVRELERTLEVSPIAKSKLIDVRYQARDPRLAARVLEVLSAQYLDKHLSVHRSPGALDFFQQQTDQYQKGLASAEKRLAEFSLKKGVVSIEIEKDIALHRLSDFEAQLRETQTAEAAVEQRIKSLESQAKSTPSRVVTQMRSSDNPLLMQQLKSTLLNLELKRTELLTKYEPGYRAVQEVDTQIAQAREAIAQAGKNASHDEVTDLDKTRQWLDEESARARAELATLKARETENAKSVEQYRGSSRQISRNEIEHQDLVRAAKTAEENYLLYLRKQEEGRISDELDRKRIVNVAIAEAATVPALPSSPRTSLNLILGFVLAFLGSLGLVFVVDYMDPSFRTPDEVEGYLGVPVLASMPRAN